MQLSDFDYQLPRELIAQEPLAQRDASRMLVLDRKKKAWTDSQFAKLPDYLHSNDVLVINNTRVFPARLLGRRDPSGGCVEVLLVRELEPLLWEALVKPGQRLKLGSRIEFAPGRLHAELVNEPGNDLRQVRFECTEPWESLLDALGQTPLPPYIDRPAGSSINDRERYQTVFARKKGAIAAPTAGFHFTPRIIKDVLACGARVVEVTLHVGYGTFEPVRVQNIEQHRVSAERFEITDEAAQLINHARAQGGRVIAIGTTTTRALEAAANSKGEIQPVRKSTELTITPGYDFRIVNVLLTNFHLPCSSLLLLVSAFADHNFIFSAYRHAVEARYRFYSYGDCMLVI